MSNLYESALLKALGLPFTIEKTSEMEYQLKVHEAYNKAKIKPDFIDAEFVEITDQLQIEHDRNQK